MADPRAPLCDAVRLACSPRAWSRGVELTRAGAVVAEPSDDPEELRFRIVRGSGMIARQVALWPDDAEWDCPCDESDEACEHVAAAVIALRRSDEGGKGVQTLEQAGHVDYRFGRDGEQLTLARFIVTDGDEHRLTATLAALAAGRVEGPRFAAGQKAGGRAPLHLEHVESLGHLGEEVGPFRRRHGARADLEVLLHGEIAEDASRLWNERETRSEEPLR